jgi:hypothetical protein
MPSNHLDESLNTIVRTCLKEKMGFIAAIVFFLLLFGSLGKSPIGRLFILIMMAGGLYVFYWKWTTGGF